MTVVRKYIILIIRNGGIMDNLIKKLNRFSDAVSSRNDKGLMDFYNEIIDEIKPILESEGEKDFQIYDLNIRLAKLQVFIFMTHLHRLRDERFKFINKYDPFKIFIKSKLYDDFLRKAMDYEYKDEPLFIPIKRTNKVFFPKIRLQC